MTKFKNQYILLPNQGISDIGLEWTKESFESFTLFSASDLPKYVHKGDDYKIVLLGFAFSVLDSNPNENTLVQNVPLDNNAFLDYLDSLCGNFVLFFEKDGQLRLFNDAAGVMKIFYAIKDKQLNAVASDPSLLRKACDLVVDDREEAEAFYQSHFFKKHLIRMGDKTQYVNVFQVLPNHTIDLNQAKVERYFPREKMEEISLQESIQRVNDYFSNVIYAAARRYDLKCSLTAGWDSRMVAALTHKHKADVLYYTFIHPGYDEKHHDIRIPKNISKTLGLKHELISKKEMMKEEEIEDAKASFDLLSKENFQNIMGGYSRFNGPKDLVLIGSVSEICKNYFDEVIINDGKSLTQAAHFPVISYCIKHFDERYQEVKALEKKFGYDLRDIVHWEQDITNFAAKRSYYMSFITRPFSPFNSRLIIKTILASPRKCRDKHIHPYYQSYLDRYCPELSRFPINPTSRKRLMVMGKKLGVYPLYKKLSTKLRK